MKVFSTFWTAYVIKKYYTTHKKHLRSWSKENFQYLKERAEKCTVNRMDFSLKCLLGKSEQSCCYLKIC